MIRAFAERKAADFERWIERTAIRDPSKAATLYLAAIEYHIPRLQRTDVRVGLPAFVGEPMVITDPIEAAAAYERIMRGDIAINSVSFALPAPNTVLGEASGATSADRQTNSEIAPEAT
jgi:hypothetical protein